MTDEPEGISRRRFLGYVLAAPTLVTGVRLIESAAAEAATGQTIPSVGQIAESYDLLDFLRTVNLPTANLITIALNEDGTVGFAMHRSEVGQGLSTAVAMIIAEEMGVALDQVHVTLADARPDLLFNQLTGGSNSIFTIYEPVRLAAAVARGRILGAAASRFGVDPSTLSIANGVVTSLDGQTAGVGSLTVAAASNVVEFVDTGPKSAADFTVIGTAQNRVDARSMVTGERKFVADLAVVPDALPTMVARPPTINGVPRSVRNLDDVLAMPGISDVAVVSTGVAVRGRTFGQCIDAVNALDVVWGPGTVDGLSDEGVQAALVAAELPMVVPNLGGLPDLGLGIGLHTIDATFTFPFAPNCPLETNCAIADVRGNRAEIWGPMKTPLVALQRIAERLGIPEQNVAVHVVQAGGSFGRDLFFDAPLEAAEISRAMGKPVKLMWARTDDFRHGRTHPACRSTIRAVHTAKEVVAFLQHQTSVNTDFGHGLGELFTSFFDELPTGLGGLTFSQTVWYLTQYLPYNFGLVEQQLTETLPGVAEPATNLFHTGSMRNIYSPNVVCARELVIDRIVEAIGADPYEFRLAALKDERSKAVLRKVAAVGNWGRPMAPGTAQGLGFHSEYKGRAACLMEVDATPATVNRDIRDATTGPRVTKAVFAVDVGLPINPRGLEAQMMGGMMDGIAHAFTFALHLRDGAFAEGSWDHAYYTRQWNVPFDVEVIVMPPTTGEPGGAGEFGVAAAFAAAATAYTRATGTMPTHFPINFGDPLGFTPIPRVPPLPESPTDGLAGLVR